MSVIEAPAAILWTEVKADELWTATLDSGESVVIWHYSDPITGEAFKLLGDRDYGDYVGVDFAQAAAVVVDRLDALFTQVSR